MQIAKAHFSYTIWFVISENSACKDSLWWCTQVASKFSLRHTQKCCTWIYISFSFSSTLKYLSGIVVFIEKNSYIREKKENFTTALAFGQLLATYLLNKCSTWCNYVFRDNLYLLLYLSEEIQEISNNFSLELMQWFFFSLFIV